jgi:HK97 family phage prohead protease
MLDGRTIMPGAFKHQDKLRVPLVWQHGHNDPENVLGHAILENRDDGVYAHGYFNDSAKAKQTRELLQHGDISMLSIWANQLVERAGKVLHGAIREVSLVLSGANPGALIENVTLHHSEGDEVLDDEAIITTGLEIEANEPALTHAGLAQDDTETIQDVYDSMSDKQKEVLHFMLGQALEGAGGSLSQSDIDNDSTTDDSTTDDSTTDDSTTDDSTTDDSTTDDTTTDDSNTDQEGTQMGTEAKHNVFEGEKEGEGTKPKPYFLSHDDVGEIVGNAKKIGSLKEAVQDFALAHGITDIDLLFPDAVAVDTVPEFLQRRTEWVNGWMSGARKSPFSRIKTLAADITIEEARAKGYATGALKKEEFFSVSRRVTTPTTVYKKQKLDRDDVVDITDFDVVAWLKAEMRVMLDEEIARAALMGDGRDISSEDKINEQNIRPIATDHELYVTTLRVNMLDASSSISEFVDAVISNRSKYKGSGVPTMYTTETVIAQFLSLKDTLGRYIYDTVEQVAAKLRVSSIVPVEAMEEDDDLVAIIVNPADYVYGATRGGEVNMFDDFDIDYNQYKYLIETRCCGALTRLKSAIVVRQQLSGSDAAVVPNAPTFDEDTGVVTIVATTHITYKNADTDATLSTGAQTALGVGETLNVRAVASSGFYVADSDDSYWSFTKNV